jgi:hypothetical protein
LIGALPEIVLPHLLNIDSLPIATTRGSTL